MKAYKYQRNVIDDMIHRYGRTLTELAIEIPDSKEWLVCNESAVLFTDKPFAIRAMYEVDFLAGMSKEERRALTPQQREAKRIEALKLEDAKDAQDREESRKAAEVIEISVEFYKSLFHLATLKKEHDALKKQCMPELKTILGQSKGYVG
jgi:hypothetical protein